MSMQTYEHTQYEHFLVVIGLSENKVRPPLREATTKAGLSFSNYIPCLWQNFSKAQRTIHKQLKYLVITKKIGTSCNWRSFSQNLKKATGQQKRHNLLQFLAAIDSISKQKLSKTSWRHSHSEVLL